VAQEEGEGADVRARLVSGKGREKEVAGGFGRDGPAQEGNEEGGEGKGTRAGSADWASRPNRRGGRERIRFSCCFFFQYCFPNTFSKGF
jgi:hypothetical protein